MADPGTKRKIHVTVWVDGVLEMEMVTYGAEPNHSAVVLQAERKLLESGLKDVEVYNWDVVPGAAEGDNWEVVPDGQS